MFHLGLAQEGQPGTSPSSVNKTPRLLSPALEGGCHGPGTWPTFLPASPCMVLTRGGLSSSCCPASDKSPSHHPPYSCQQADPVFRTECSPKKLLSLSLSPPLVLIIQSHKGGQCLAPTTRSVDAWHCTQAGIFHKVIFSGD